MTDVLKGIATANNVTVPKRYFELLDAKEDEEDVGEVVGKFFERTGIKVI